MPDTIHLPIIKWEKLINLKNLKIEKFGKARVKFGTGT